MGYVCVIHKYGIDTAYMYSSTLGHLNMRAFRHKLLRNASALIMLEGAVFSSRIRRKWAKRANRPEMEDLPFYYKVYVALHKDVGLQCVNLIVMKVIESVSPFERVPSVPFSYPHPNAFNVVVGRFFFLRIASMLGI